MSELKCEYHAKRTAVDKCSRCNRMICLEDKNNISQGRSYYNQTNSFSHSYYNITLCSMCYYDAAVEGKNLVSRSMNIQKKMILIIPAFVLLFPVGFFFLFTNLTGSDSPIFSRMLMFFLFPIIIFIIIALAMSKGGSSMMTKVSDQNVEQAKKAKEKLLSSMDAQASKEFLSKQLTCFNCGDVLDINSLFCMNCGDSTKEERAQVGLS